MLYQTKDLAMKIVDFFDRLYNLTQFKVALLEKIHFNSILRFLIREMSNFILPLLFRIEANDSKYSIYDTNFKDQKIVVSLTSFPARINKLWLVIETILRQTHKPDILVLWLSKDQFSGFKSLPKRLLKLQERGLIIEFVNNDLRSHKKYYYSFLKYPNDIIITIDDDVYYNSQLIEHLVNCSKKFPDTICCTNSCKISFSEKVLLPYNMWVKNRKFNYPSLDIFPIGVGGVLYPKNSFNNYLTDFESFMKYCPTADDVWLRAMSLINNKNATQTKYQSLYLPIKNRKNQMLHSINLHGPNDLQISQVRQYCIKNFNIDPYSYEHINQ